MMEKSVIESRIRWDYENLSRRTGAQQSAAYRAAVAREVAALESQRIVGG